MDVVCKLKRSMAALLTAAMVFTSVDVTAFAAGPAQADPETGVLTVTDAELVADRHFKGENEDQAAVICGPAIDHGKTYEGVAPENDDELISVENADANGGTITVKKYTDDEGNEWSPRTAWVKATDGDAVLTTIDNWTSSDDAYTAEYSLSGDIAAYYIEVEYVWSETVESDTYTRLLNATSQLVTGVKKMDGVADEASNLDALASLFVVTQKEIQKTIDDYKASGSMENVILAGVLENTIKGELDKHINASIEAIDTLKVFVKEYEDSAWVSGYVWENHTGVKDAVAEVSTKLTAFSEYLEGVQDDLIEKGYSLPAIESLKAKIDDSIEGTDVINADSYWDFLGLEPGFAAGLDANKKKALDNTILALAEGEDVAVPDKESDSFVAYVQNLTCKVNVWEIQINLHAKTAPAEAVEFDAPLSSDAIKGELEPLESKNAVLYVPTEMIEDGDDTNEEALIEDKISEILASWEELPAEYDHSLRGGKPSVDTENCIMTLDIDITPKYYDVTLGDTVYSYPYGTKINLSAHQDTLKQSYDYTLTWNPDTAEPMVETIYQGDRQPEVTAALHISRMTLPIKNTYSVTKLLAEDARYGYDAAEKAVEKSILLNPALNPVDPVKYRVPSDSAVLFDIDPDHAENYKVTAESVHTEGLIWVPQTVVFVDKDGSEKSEELVKEGDVWTFAWEIPQNDTLKNIKVVYKMEVLKSADKIKEYRDLPAELKKNIDAQKELLISEDSSKVTAKKVYEAFTPSVLDTLDPNVLNIAKLALDTPGDKAVDAILDYGWDETYDQPMIYTYLSNANAVGWSFGACVQQKIYTGIGNQASALLDNLEIITSDSGYNLALKEAGIDSGSIDNLCEKLDGYVTNYKNNPVHPALNLEHGDFAALLAVIEDKNNDFAEYAAEKTNLEVGYELLKAKPTDHKLTMTVLVERDGGFDEASKTIIVEKDEVVKEADVLADLAALEDSIERYTKNEDRYNKEDDKLENLTFDSETHETILAAHASVTRTYNREEYTFKVVEGNTEITTTAEFGQLYKMELAKAPEGSDGSTYYRYYYNENEDSELQGLTGEEDVYEYYPSQTQIDAANGVIVIYRKTIDKTQEEIENFADKLNSGLGTLVDENGNRQAVFVPVQNSDGKYESIVFRMTASQNNDSTDMMTALQDAFFGLNYNYVAFKFGEELSVFSRPDEDTGVKLDMQAILDMFLMSGLSKEKVAGTYDENGNLVTPGILVPKKTRSSESKYEINQFNPGGTPDTELIGESGLGGLFSEGKIYLGDTESNATELDFYMTFGPGSEGLLESIMNSKYDFALNGGFVLSAELPEDMYTLWLSAMLLLDRTDLSELENRQLIHDVETIKEMVLVPLFESDEDITPEMLEDTLKGVGFGMDLTSSTMRSFVEQLIKGVDSMLTDAEAGDLEIVESTENEGPVYAFTMYYDMASMLDEYLSMKDEESGTAIKGSDLFSNTTIKIPVKAVVLNYENGFPYEALVVEPMKVLGGKANLMNTARYVTDLEAALKNANGPVYAVLLKDLNEVVEVDEVTKEETRYPIVIPGTTILDLNGQKVTGTLKSTGSLRIVSNILDSDKAGTVRGALEGTIKAAAGTYLNADGTVMALGSALQAGYMQDENTGVVTNNLYSITDDGNELKVFLDLEKIVSETNRGNLLTVASDIVSDVFLNLEVNAALTVDGDAVYDIDVDDVLGVLGNREFDAIAKDLLDDVDAAGIKALANKLANDLTDVQKINKAVKDGDILASYELTTAPWEIRPTVENGEIKVGIGSGETSTKKVVLEVAPLSETQYETLKELYDTINDFVSIKDRAFTLGEISIADGKIQWTGSAKATVEIDITGEDGEASDQVVALAVILAHDIDDADVKAAYIQNIRNYKKNIWDGDLKKAINETTIETVLNAMEASKGTSFNKMVSDLGLSREIGNMEGIYQSMLTVASRLSEYVDRILGYDHEATSAVRTYLSNPIGGLEDGETFSGASHGMNAELTIVLKLFGGDYKCTVQDVINLIEELPVEFEAGKYDVTMSLTDDQIVKSASLVAQIEALLNTQIEALVKANYDHFEKYTNAVDYLANNEEAEDKLVSGIVEKIAALPYVFEVAEYADFLASNKTLDKIDASWKTEDIKAQVNEITNALTQVELQKVKDACAAASVEFAKYENAVDYFTNLEKNQAAYALKGELEDLQEYMQDMLESGLELNGELDTIISDYDALRDRVLGNPDKNIKGLLEKYNELTADAKAIVGEELKKALDDAVAYFKANDEVLTAAATALYGVKASLKDREDYGSADEIKAAKEAYDNAVALYGNKNDSVKAYLQNKYGDWVEAYNEAADYFTDSDMKKFQDTANAVKIPADPAVVLDSFEDDYNNLQTAIELYEKLTQAEKDYVAAEYARMQAAKEYFNQSIVFETIKAIDELDSIFLKDNYEAFLKSGGELDNFDEIKKDAAEAYSLYEGLSESGKAYVRENSIFEKYTNAVSYFNQRVGLWVTEIEDCTYNGAAHKPTVAVYEGLVKLTEKVDYTVSYRNNKNAFENVDKLVEKKDAKALKKAPQVQIKFKKNYTGTVTKYFNIEKINLSEYKDADYLAKVGLKIENSYSVVSKKAKTVKPTLYLNGKKVSSSEYTLSFNDKSSGAYAAKGEYTITITGKKNFKGTAVAKQIVQETKYKATKLNSKMFTLNFKSKAYTGKAIELGNKEFNDSNLKLGEDYTISYQNNVNKGTASVIFTGRGDYTGTVKKTFKITARTLNSSHLDAESKGFSAEYQKGGVKPSDKIIVEYDGKVLQETKDYTISWKNNKGIGTASYTIKGKNNYVGSISGSFKIVKADLYQMVEERGGDGIVATSAAYKAKKNNFVTKLTLTDVNGKKLSAGRDYNKTFTYEYKNADGEWVKLNTGDMAPLVNGTKGTTIRATVTGIGNYEGTVSVEYTLSTLKISSAKAPKKTVTYNGSAQEPPIPLTYKGKTLRLGTDYEIEYSANRLVGTGIATVTGMGEYWGTKRIVFKITKCDANWAINHSNGNAFEVTVLFEF